MHNKTVPFRFIFSALMALAVLSGMYAEELVILHTNDTHSQIEPNDRNLGGILRRKALIDSVRGVHDNVLLVDAGDMVQGTLYFTLFGGEVEAKLMNYLGYDMQILGNHEFDNGVEALASVFGKLNAKKLSTNYDFTTTPLADIFIPYEIKKYDGRKIGFIAINLNPKGMISDDNARGVKYLDGITAANATAWHLKHNEKADMVIAITHIGYSDEPFISDVDLASKSENIDIIIGGHSHTAINPADSTSVAWLVDNAAGKPVLIAQTGKSGVNVGEIVIDLDTFDKNSRLLPVDSCYDRFEDSRLDSILAPYKESVEEFRNAKIGKTKGLKKSDWSLVNWMADYVFDEARNLTDEKIDLAIVNKGGVRADMPAGNVTKGTIMQIFPFENRIVVERVTGRQLRDALDIMARRGGDGVSKGVMAEYDAAAGKCVSVMVDGRPIDDDKYYNVATIDYLANGGDYMEPLRKGEIIARSNEVLYNDMIDHLQKNKKTLKADRTLRMYPKK